jgi:stress response protein SCP2
VRGQKAPLSDVAGPIVVTVRCGGPGLLVDTACLGLDAAGRIADDRYTVFYNQPASPDGAVRLVDAGPGFSSYELRLGALAGHVHRLLFTAAIDGDGTMAGLGPGTLEVGADIRFGFSGGDFAAEKALVVGELYRRDGGWRVGAVGQGFDGGLGALLRSYGAVVDDEGAGPGTQAGRPPAAPVTGAGRPPAAPVDLDKRVAEVAPQLVDLRKRAKVSIEKAGLGAHRARVALCLDISASMAPLYRDGRVQALADRVMALATRFDDDGVLDVFLFGDRGHQPLPMALDRCSTYVRDLLGAFPLEPGTRYHTAMKLVREHLFGSSGPRWSPYPAPLPAYVMIVTDGGTSNRESAMNQVRWSSWEPVFWQFMGLGPSQGPKGATFGFLETLDTLGDRLIDNAAFFGVEDPARMGDDALFAAMMTEYPGWVKAARGAGVIGPEPG